MTKDMDIKQKIDQFIQNSSGRILSVLIDDCRNELKNYPPEIRAGIHLAALHSVKNVVLFAGSATDTGQDAEPYHEKIRQIKGHIDVFNDEIASWSIVEPASKESSGIPRKKWTKKSPIKTANLEKMVPKSIRIAETTEPHPFPTE